jgi:uncharacterized protein YukE
MARLFETIWKERIMAGELADYTGGGALTAMSGGGTLPPYRRSRTGRAIAQVQGQALVRATAIDLEAKLDGLKLMLAGSTVRTAQSEVAMVAQAASELAKAVPAAAQGLAHINTVAVIQIGEMVADSLTKLRRM